MRLRLLLSFHLCIADASIILQCSCLHQRMEQKYTKTHLYFNAMRTENHLVCQMNTEKSHNEFSSQNVNDCLKFKSRTHTNKLIHCLFSFFNTQTSKIFATTVKDNWIGSTTKMTISVLWFGFNIEPYLLVLVPSTILFFFLLFFALGIISSHFSHDACLVVICVKRKFPLYSKC